MTRKKWAAPLIGVIAAACGDAVGVRTANDVTVNHQTVGIAALEGVQIDTLWVVVGGAKLETAGVDSTVDQVFTESRILRASLSGGLATARVTLDVPAGTYKEVEIYIDKLEPGKPGEDALIATRPNLANASILIKGRVIEDGSAGRFTFTAALDHDMEVKLEPFLVVQQGVPVRVLVTLDTTGWFRNAAGNLVDPRHPTMRSIIEGNMLASFAAAVAP